MTPVKVTKHYALTNLSHYEVHRGANRKSVGQSSESFDLALGVTVFDALNFGIKGPMYRGGIILAPSCG